MATPEGAAPLLKALQGQHVSLNSRLLAIILMQWMPFCKRGWQHGLRDMAVKYWPVVLYRTHEGLKICNVRSRNWAADWPAVCRYLFSSWLQAISTMTDLVTSMQRGLGYTLRSMPLGRYSWSRLCGQFLEKVQR